MYYRQLIIRCGGVFLRAVFSDELFLHAISDDARRGHEYQK